MTKLFVVSGDIIYRDMSKREMYLCIKYNCYIMYDGHCRSSSDKVFCYTLLDEKRIYIMYLDKYNDTVKTPRKLTEI